MLIPAPSVLRSQLRLVLADKAAQGCDVAGWPEQLDELPDSIDALVGFARSLGGVEPELPWADREPAGLEEIWRAADPGRTTTVLGRLPAEEAASRARAGALSSIVGCTLGKVAELGLSMDDLRRHLEPLGEWPIRHYLTTAAVDALPERQVQWAELVRERIAWVAPDDDINYRVIGLLGLERHGLGLTGEQLVRLWLYNLPVLATFGPERAFLLTAGLATLDEGTPDLREWLAYLNPGEELCGALIRVDAYGYGCLGRPDLAAELAWRDASLTHRRTGVYAAMFVAAAIAAAPFVTDPLAMFEIAARYIPTRSRMRQAVDYALEEVDAARDWIDGAERIGILYGDYGHCRVLQEIGTVINTLRFAESVDDGLAIQVSQGNDTDSFGATAGSLLGVYFGEPGPGRALVEPLNDRIHVALATWYDDSLSALIGRFGELPGRLTAELEGGTRPTQDPPWP